MSKIRISESGARRRVVMFGIALAALCIYAAITCAGSLAVGGMHLSGDMEISDDKVELTNGATLEISGTPWKCDVCGKTVQDAHVTAKAITADLRKTPDKKLALTKAVATTGVVIHARQVDKAKKSTRFVHATGEKAVYTPAAGTEEATIVLTGNAAVKLTDPELEEPATLTGSTVTVYLNKNKISVKSGDMRVKPKEGAQQ